MSELRPAAAPASAPPAAPQKTAASAGSPAESVTILAAGAARLPQRRSGHAQDRAMQLAALLRDLTDDAAPLSEPAFRQSLEARTPASIKALAVDLACYARFRAERGGPGLPADEARLAAYVGYCGERRLKPATLSRRLSSLAAAHRLLGMPAPTGAAMVRDAVRAVRRRAGARQRQAGPLRLGEGVGREAARGFTLTALLDACRPDIVGLRDAALLSLGYDAGLRVCELVRVEVDWIAPQQDGSAMLGLPGESSRIWLSPDTMRRVAAWREAAGIGSGPLFRRVAVTRTRARAAREALAIGDLAYHARVDRDRMAARPARAASVTYSIGAKALTPAAVRLILRRVAQAAADRGLVDLAGAALADAIAGLSARSLRVGLTQDLFAHGEDAGAVAQALRWMSPATALRYGRQLAPAPDAAARVLARVRK